MPPNTSKDSLYSRLGGYYAIAAVADDHLHRLRGDPRLQRFWTSPRSIDTNNRERQLLVDFIPPRPAGLALSPRFPFSAGCIIITLGFRFRQARAEMAAVLYAFKRGRMTVSREPAQLHRAT